MALGVSCSHVRLQCQPQRRCTLRLIICAAQQQHEVQPVRQDASRRAMLLSAASLLAGATLATAPAQAGLVENILKERLRPEVEPIEAIVRMLDARGVLYEIKALAAAPTDSPLRKSSNSLLPGYATRLREVGPSAPTVAALATGMDKEAQVSEQYGGEAGESASLTDPVFITVGQILNYSGRGLREEALANPAFAEAAIAAVEDLLAKVPENSMSTAVAQREAARAAKR